MGRIFVYKSSTARRAVCTCVYIQIFFVHNVGEPWKNIREFPAMGKNQNYWGDGGQILGRGGGGVSPHPPPICSPACFMRYVTSYQGYITCYMGYITCYTGYITCYLGYITCYMGYITCYPIYPSF